MHPKIALTVSLRPEMTDNEVTGGEVGSETDEEKLTSAMNTMDRGLK